MRPLLVATLTAAACLGAAGPASAGAISGPQEIAFLNAQRSANGIPGDLTENPDWSAGCAAHMDYVRQNGGVPVHDETPGNPGYSDAGRDAAKTSVLTTAGSAFTAAGANQFETAPIHLMQMLEPYLTQSGASDGCLATLRSGSFSRPFDAQGTFSYPGDGSTTVPVSEVANESPFVPGQFVGIPAGTRTGPYLYFYYVSPGGGYFTKGVITSATLTGPSGPVDVRSVDDHTTDPTLGDLGMYMAPGGMLIPVAPLVPNKRYTATVTFQPDADPTIFGSVPAPAVSRTWSFSAGAVVTTPSPTPTPIPTPVGTAPAPPVIPKLTGLVLKSRSVEVKSTATASLWVTVEQRTSRPRAKKVTWKLRRSLPLPATAGQTTRLSLKRLTRGAYRVQIHQGLATGAVLVSRTVTLK